MTTHVLFCTVGGSHHPIISAIEALRASAAPGGDYFVCFFCTDTHRGRPGSITQICGEGNVIKADVNDAEASLPNIPTQTGLESSRFQVCIVPPDHLDEGYVLMRERIRKLSEAHRTARFVADYTGGTKAMTAALVCAAMESNNIDLQVISGRRLDLVSVSHGTHAAAAVNVSRMRADREVTRCLRLWERFAYHEASRELNKVVVNAGTPEEERVGLARTLSAGLALWDGSDYKAAFDLLDMCRRDVCSRDGSMVGMFETIGLLAGEDSDKREIAGLFDLWLNAKRRAAQGRFDDAVSRWYRLTEWTAQWLLKKVLGIESTASFPRRELPAGVDVSGTGDSVEIGLWKAWLVVKGRFNGDAKGVEGAARKFMDHDDRRLLHLLQKRNNTLLAHGFNPVSEGDWKSVDSFTEESMLPVLEAAFREVKLKKKPQQLPASPPGFLLAP